MDAALVVVAIVIAVVVIWVVFLLRDRLLELSVNAKETTLKAKMEGKTGVSEDIQDDKPVGVVFKGNKLRGEGMYRMRDTEFSENDVDGKQNLELGYDQPSGEVQSKENQ